MYEQLLLGGSYFLLFFLLVMVGILGFFPPSKIIYGVAGFLASQGSLNLFFVILSGGLGHTVGNYVQYEIGRRKGLGFLEKLLAYYPLFTMKDVTKIQLVFEKKGAWFFLIGKLLDPIKLFISFCVGFSKMNRFLFLVLAFIGSLIWAFLFSILGFYFGKSFEQFGYVGIIIVGLAALFLYFFYKYMNSKEIEDLLDKK